MHDIHKFRNIYKLKSIYRFASVYDRHESAAEHTWSALMLSDYILIKSNLKIDRPKVLELLMYHDLVEIYAGDTPIDPNIGDQKKAEHEQSIKEHEAFERLVKELPEEISRRYTSLYKEYVEHKTLESRFAMGIEHLDAEIHEMDHKEDWKGWTEKFLRNKKQKYFKEFPIMMEIFEEHIRYLNYNGFFDEPKKTYDNYDKSHDIHKFRTIYRLKSIYRLNTVDDRHESTAEHTWSAMMLADYILSKYSSEFAGIDKFKVLELIMYHDLVEIHAGDTPLYPGMKDDDQKKREGEAFKKLIAELPQETSEKYRLLHSEFEGLKTKEARLAKAVEELDSSIHELDHKKDWKGWSEKFLREKKTRYYQEFPVIMELFQEFLDYANDNGFFTQ